MNKGRFREFYQCDYDIAGVYPLMVADSEALKVLTEILDTLPGQSLRPSSLPDMGCGMGRRVLAAFASSTLVSFLPHRLLLTHAVHVSFVSFVSAGIGPYQVRLNHRKLLDGMMQLCGVPEDKLRPICSAIDKLDKEVWLCAEGEKCSCVKHEMVRTKGLDEAAADRLGELVKIKGEPMAVLAQLRAVPGFADHPLAGEGLRELEVLFSYLTALGCLSRICFDLSLARGLDYYTGVIYEAGQTGPSRVGSIAAGGRYDGLVGMFSSKHVPAVGVSIGIERILTIMEEAEAKKGKIRRNVTQVYVGSIGDGLLTRRMELSAALWQLGIAAEYSFDLNPKPKKQLDAALANGIPYVLWVGEEELARGEVKLKDMGRKTEELIPLADAAKIVRLRIKTAEREEDDAVIKAMEDAKI